MEENKTNMWKNFGTILMIIGFILGVLISVLFYYSSKPKQKIEPYYDWICSREYAYEGTYWITCKKYICFDMYGKKYCKYLNDELKLELMK